MPDEPLRDVVWSEMPTSEKPDEVLLKAAIAGDTEAEKELRRRLDERVRLPVPGEHGRA